MECNNSVFKSSIHPRLMSLSCGLRFNKNWYLWRNQLTRRSSFRRCTSFVFYSKNPQNALSPLQKKSILPVIQFSILYINNHAQFWVDPSKTFLSTDLPLKPSVWRHCLWCFLSRSNSRWLLPILKLEINYQPFVNLLKQNEVVLSSLRRFANVDGAMIIGPNDIQGKMHNNELLYQMHKSTNKSHKHNHIGHTKQRLTDAITDINYNHAVKSKSLTEKET